MNIKKFFIPAVIIILIGLALIFIWLIRQQQNEAQLQGLQAIAPELKPIETETEIEVFTISAQVREVRAASLLVDTLSNDLTDKAPLAREVLVTNDTVIMRRALKDSQVYEREITAYRNLIAELKTQVEETGIQPEEWPLVPANFIETEITLNQIETGSRVWIIAGEDIRTAESFTAASIKVEV